MFTCATAPPLSVNTIINRKKIPLFNDNSACELFVDVLDDLLRPRFLNFFSKFLIFFYFDLIFTFRHI